MPRIPVWFQFLVQIIGVAGQVYLVSDFIDSQTLIHFCQVTISFLQTVVGIWGHYSNPDGTKPEVAYVPKRKTMKFMCFILLLISLLIPISNLFAANGDEFGTTLRGEFGFKLLDAQSATADGVWVSVSNIRSATVCHSGLEAGGSVTIQVLNDVTKPANATDGHIAATLAPGAGTACTSISMLPARFMKAEKSAGGAPTGTTVLLWGLNR